MTATNVKDKLGPMLIRFTESLAALREFVELIEPHIEKYHESIMENEPIAMIPMILAMKKLRPSHPFTTVFTEVSEERLRGLFDGEILIDEGGGEGDFSMKVSGFHAATWRRTLTMLNRSKAQIDHLYRSSLISLVTTSEWFVSQMITSYHRLFPEMISGRDKVLSLDDVMTFGGIDEVREHLIACRVEDIMRGPFTDWLKFFKEKPKLSASYIDGEMDDLVEIFQRRNLLVHNGGIVNSIYMSRVSSKHRNGLVVGSEIKVDREYLDNATSALEACLILLCAELWKKLDSADLERAHVLMTVGYEHMMRERWNIAERCYAFVARDVAQEEASRLASMINQWQCKKWRGEDIASEVKSYDFSAKERKYILASMVLLEDIEGSLALARELIGSGALTVEDLQEWPLFRDMRRIERWVDMVDEFAQKGAAKSIAAPADEGDDTEVVGGT